MVCGGNNLNRTECLFAERAQSACPGKGLEGREREREGRGGWRMVGPRGGMEERVRGRCGGLELKRELLE